MRVRVRLICNYNNRGVHRAWGGLEPGLGVVELGLGLRLGLGLGVWLV